MFKFIDKLYEKKVSSKGMAIFRITFALNLLFEIFHIYEYRNLYYDSIPFVEESILSNGVFIYIWMTLLVLLVLGFKTRLAAIFNYIFLISFVINNLDYEYHMDYAYVGVSFLMILLPLSKSYSIDNLLERLKYSSKNKLHIPEETTSKLYYFILILLAVAFVYFDSIFYKVRSDGWMGGLGMWLPASLPQTTLLDDQWLLNQKYIMLFLGYLTFAFELIFPFVFFIKKMRWPLSFIGIALHIGIFLEFPIPFFGLGVCAVYLALIPLYFWKYIEQKIQFRRAKLTFYYDEECPLCLRVKIIINYLDITKAIDFKGVQSFSKMEPKLEKYTEDELLDSVFSVDYKGNVKEGVDTYFSVFKYVLFLFPFLFFRLPILYNISKKIYKIIAINRNVERCSFDNCILPGAVNTYIDSDQIKLFKNFKIGDLKRNLIKYALVFFALLQLNVTFTLVSTNFVSKRIPSKGVVFETVTFIREFTKNVQEFSHYFFGITAHGVFIDGHFKGYEKVYALKYNDQFLPTTNENGMPGNYLRGGSWVNYTFRTNGPYVDINKQDFFLRLEKGLGRYAAFWSHENSVINPSFELVEKNIRVPYQWEKDLLKNNMNSPWKVVATASYDSQSGDFHMQRIKK